MTKKILTPTEYSEQIDAKRKQTKHINEFAEWFNSKLTTSISIGVATIRSVELFDIPDKFTVRRKSDMESLKFTPDIVDYLKEYGWIVQEIEVNPEFPHTKNVIQLLPS